jgi:SulP family sulfate permease
MSWTSGLSAALHGPGKTVAGLGLFRHYTYARLRLDATAALVVWAVVVPQGLAYGELAGLASVAGLYTAMTGMLLYGLFGSSRYLNVGPESSVAIVVAAAIAPLSGGDPERAAALTAMLAALVGVYLVIGAVLRLGIITRLLSTPILIGYLAGSAVIILSSQLPKVFGIEVEGDEWWRRVWGVVSHLGDTNAWALTIGVGTIGVVLLIQRLTPQVPAYLVAVLVAIAMVSAANLAEANDVAVVGKIESGIPAPSLPDVSLDDSISLLSPAAAVALLVFAGSAATGAALAARDREDLNQTRELVGLAAANFGSGLFQGYPANGSDSRSFIVAESKARSQRVNVFCGLMIVITLFVLAPLFRNLPMATLGAIVLLSAAKLIDPGQFKRLWAVRKADWVLAIITTAGVLLVGVLEGLAIGVVLSLLEVMRRAVFPPSKVLGLVDDIPTYRDVESYQGAETAPGLLVYRFDAPLFFANAEVFRSQIGELVHNASEPVRVVVVSAEGINDLDVTGAETLERLADDLEAEGIRLVLARVRTSVRTTLRRLGLEEKIGPENFFLRVTDATSALGLSSQIEGGRVMEDIP